MNKKEKAALFLLGLMTGRKGLPFAWHVFYIVVILVLSGISIFAKG